MTRPVIIAGGGIGGLTLALTLNQIGVPCQVLEAARDMKPLGVGINIQPNAVRELFDLGIGPDKLDAVGDESRGQRVTGMAVEPLVVEKEGQGLRPVDRTAVEAMGLAHLLRPLFLATSRASSTFEISWVSVSRVTTSHDRSPCS